MVKLKEIIKIKKKNSSIKNHLSGLVCLTLYRVKYSIPRNYQHLNAFESIKVLNMP